MSSSNESNPKREELEDKIRELGPFADREYQEELERDTQGPYHVVKWALAVDWMDSNGERFVMTTCTSDLTQWDQDALFHAALDLPRAHE